MSQSCVFKRFKREMGQANHFLITIMVGLDAVEHGAEKDEAFHVSWNPKDVSRTVARSKQYAIKSSLAWAVDSVDMYLRLCNQEPRLYQESESRIIGGTGHSVYNKFKCVVETHKDIDPCKTAFLDLLICWRNNLTHYGAENKLLESSTRFFETSTQNELLQKYHFDVTPMIERFNKGDVPTFKETTTMISMAIHFVEELDQILVEEINQAKYLKCVIQSIIQKQPYIITSLYINTDAEKRLKMIKQFLATGGIGFDFYDEEGIQYLRNVSELEKRRFELVFS